MCPCPVSYRMNPVKNNKVVFLVGGKGSRLGSLTTKIPKPMIDIAGTPMLEHIVRHVQGFGFTNFLFKTNYLSEVIERHFGKGDKYGVNIEYLVEQEPLGTGGGLSFLKNETGPVKIVYGDVLFNIDLNKLLSYHKKNKADATLVVFETEHPEDSDILVMQNEKVVSIIHKPGNRKFGNLANAALYIFEPKCFAEIPSTGTYNLDKDLLPRLIEKGFAVYGYKIKDGEYIEDAGTPVRLAKVEQYIMSGKLSFKKGHDTIN